MLHSKVTKGGQPSDGVVVLPLQALPAGAGGVPEQAAAGGKLLPQVGELACSRCVATPHHGPRRDWFDCDCTSDFTRSSLRNWIASARSQAVHTRTRGRFVSCTRRPFCWVLFAETRER